MAAARPITPWEPVTMILRCMRVLLRFAPRQREPPGVHGVPGFPHSKVATPPSDPASGFPDCQPSPAEHGFGGLPYLIVVCPNPLSGGRFRQVAVIGTMLDKVRTDTNGA